MNWKEFLEPRWNKFLLLLAIYFFDSLINTSINIFGTRINVLNLFFYDSTAVFSYIQNYLTNSILLMGISLSLYMVSNLFYQYVISCLIVWVYKKIKKK